MLKWRQVVIWPAVFILVVDISTSAHCAVARPSRSITVVNDVAEPDNKSKKSTDVSSRVVARPANNAKLVQPDVVRSTVQARSVQNRASTRAVVARSSTNANIAETTNQPGIVLMKEQGNMLSFCKDQYTKCMDNFCNVLDDKLGRCSCSANLKNYTETEEGLKQATEELQNVAQQIQYIGLTVNQLESLFTQTEAELELQSISDNSQLKNSLDKIKAMIVEVQSGRASSNSSSGLSFDVNGLLDFSLDSNGLDLYSILGMSGSNTNSISNQRGKDLYDTAAARCRSSVLNSCQSQGVDISVITNAYDLEIDKACMAYERSLTEANDQMASTVRNATSLLQRARLMVAQQRNAYDLRQCVTELDSCMQDDFVCGRDYDNCLDPSGKYIVDGDVVVGSEPGVVGGTDKLYSTWTYSTNKNAFSSDGTLAAYIKENLGKDSSTDTDNMAQFLQNKIGYHDDSSGKNYGMCMSVLNMCQDLTYDSQGKYNKSNNVISEYLTRTLIQIKSRQDTVLADYAEDCVADVRQCLTQNGYNANNAADNAVNKVAQTACISLIKTCMSVNGVSGSVGTAATDYATWVCQMMGGTSCGS